MRRSIVLLVLFTLARHAGAEEGGASVVADPALAHGDWPERVPLAIPPGARKTAPSIALVASHRTGQSDVGAGWRLDVGSVIRRRSVSGGVPETTSDLAASQFLVDGAELVAVADPGADHYQPEVYDGSRFDFDATTNTWVRRREGWVWTYGGTGATRAIQIFPLPLPLCAAPCNTESWFLSSVVDPFGTRVDFTYEASALPSELVGLYGGFTSSRDYQVKTITYGAGTAVVTFTYATRPDVTVDLSGGFPVVHHRRLTQVASTAGGQAYTKYVLQYEDEYGSTSLLGTLTDCDNAATVAPTTPTKRSLLRKLFATSATGNQKTLIRCNRYHHESIGWYGSTDLSTVITDPFTNLEAGEDTWTPVPVELDGDGRTDLVLLAFSAEPGFEQTHHKAYVSTPKRSTPFAGPAGGGDAGVYAAAWEAELNSTLGEIVFGNKLGRAIVDLDGDLRPEVIVEAGDGARIRRLAASNTASGLAVTFSDLTNELVACDLRFGEFSDVDGDRRPDLVVRAHGASTGCASEDESYWIKNLGASPWFDSTERRDLVLPVERGFATGWSTALAVCANAEVAPPTDVNPDWSDEGYVADQTRFGDFNDDGVADAAVALYGCWAISADRWRPVLASAYSRIFLGNGKGGFVDSGLSAGPPVLLDPLDWGATTSDLTRIVPGTLAPIDFDRDGRGELLQSSYSLTDAFGQAWEGITSVLPSTGGYGVSHGALLAAHEITVAGSAWDCNELARTSAYGDFDGDGFLDLLGVQGQPGWWWAGISYSTRTASEGRMIATDNAHGGRTTLSWGFSALEPNTNPELPINTEVIQAITGPGGTRSLAYHDGAIRGTTPTPFGEVSVGNDRGGLEVYSFTISSWGGSRSQYLGARYREDGSLEHVTVLIHGEYYPTIGFFVDVAPPFFNPLLRRCEFDIGSHVGDLDALEDRCRELAWLAPAVPPSGGIPSDSIQVNDGNWDLLLGRRRQPNTVAERAAMPKLWRGRGGRDASPVATRMTGATLAETYTNVVDDYEPLVLTNTYYRWPIPLGLAAAIPDPAAEEAAYTYPGGFLFGVADGYAWDFGYDHPIHQLVTRYEHRDLATNADDRLVTYGWQRFPDPAPGITGDWWRLLRETTADRTGARLLETTQSGFAGFDSPTVVNACGRTPADCVTDRYQYFPNGTLKTHTFPDLTTERWTRLAWCGEPLTYTNAANQVTTYTRNSGGDAKCLTKAVAQHGATWTYTHDELLRPKKLVIAPGAGVNASATMTKTYYYDDALTYQATVGAREDWAYVEPRSAERRGDGQLELVYNDGLGRETKRVRCADTGTNATGGDISLVACSSTTKRVLAWNLYGADGNLKITTAPYDAGEPVVTTGYGHDGQGRRIVVMEPAHTPGAPAWRVDEIEYGAGYEERREPTATGTLTTRRSHATLSESLTVAGIARGSLTRGILGEVTSITAIDGSITRRSYDGRWHLAAETRVDAAGLPVRAPVVLADGTTALRPFEHTILARDARGRIVEEQLPDDTVISYVYDALDRIRQRSIDGVVASNYAYTPATATTMASVRAIDELGGGSATALLDGVGRIWSQTAPREATVNAYDSTGRLVSRTDIDGVTTSFYYDIHDDVTSSVNPRTGTTTYDLDGAGRPTRTTDADGVVETFAYTYSGLLHQQFDGPYLVNERSYDPRGLVTSAIEDGVATAMTYDDLGRLTKRREGVSGAQELRVTTLFYDAGDRVIETRRTPVAGLQTGTSFTHYDAWGRAYEHVDARGNVTTVAFDAAGRTRRVRDPEGSVSETIYDNQGRVVDRRVPGRGWEHVRYVGRQTFAGEPNLWRVDRFDDEDAARAVKTQQYIDGSGYLLAELRPDGTQTRWIRPTGRIVREETYDLAGALYRAVDHAYDAATGALESTTRGPYTVSYDYTPAGRLARAITPDDTLERFYEHGRLARTVEAGVTHRYGRSALTGWIVTEQAQTGTGAVRFAEIGRDGLGRIGRVAWTTGGAPETVQTYALYDYYDNAWLATNQWGANGAFTVVEAQTYDELGQPLTRTTSGAGLPGKTIAWSWFDNGVLASVTTPANHTVEYDYGATFDHQLDAIRLDGATVATITTRDLRGAITQLSLPGANQVRTTTYDDAGRPESRATGPTPLTTDFVWSATYNPDGTIATQSIDDVAGGNGWVDEYTYDAAGRLTSEVVGKTDTRYTYTLDAAGNRTALTVAPPAALPVTTSSTFAGSKLVQVGATSVTYNAWNEVSVDHHGNQYARSADGRVTAVVQGAAATALARNAEGVPIAALEPGLVLRRTTWGLSAEGLPVEVDQGNGTVLTYLDVEGQHLATAVNGAVTPIETDPRTTPLRHGTTTLGATTAFGAGATAPAGSDERFLYAMLERVPVANEIMLARHRTYDPTIGRFLEPDPIGSAGGLELFQYGHGDPVNFVDPLGHAEIGSVCSTPTITLGFPKIAPMTPQPLESGIPPSMFGDLGFGDDKAPSYRMFASMLGSSGSNPQYPPDFPIPAGPSCVVNCMGGGDIFNGGPSDPTTKPQGGGTAPPPPDAPPPPPPSAPEEPEKPKKSKPLAKLGEAIKDFVSNLADKLTIRVRDGIGTLRDTVRDGAQRIHETVPGTLGREALAREALDRGRELGENLRNAPGAIVDGAKQLGTQFRSDPVGTTVSIGTELVIGGIRDAVEGATEYGTGLRDMPGATYRLYTAKNADEANDAASDLIDAGGNLASGTYKLTGPITTLVGVGVATRGGQTAVKVAKKTYRGGAHRATKLPVGDGLDSHHMPAKASSPLKHDDGPAIQMEPFEHRMTSSHGGRTGSKEYREDIRTLIDAGKMRDAMAKEIRDVRRVTRESRGTARTYEDAMFEMLDYAKEQGYLVKPPRTAP